MFATIKFRQSQQRQLKIIKMSVRYGKTITIWKSNLGVILFLGNDLRGFNTDYTVVVK